MDVRQGQVVAVKEQWYNIKALFFGILYFLSLFSFGQESIDVLLSEFDKDKVPFISVEALNTLQNNSDIILLDSREANEYKVSHIKDAVFVGYTHFSAEAFEIKNRNKETPIVVYCSLGIRSNHIAKKLIALGYADVKNLYGGIFKWKNQGFSVVDQQGQETEKIHAYSKKWSVYLKKGTKVYEH